MFSFVMLLCCCLNGLFFFPLEFGEVHIGHKDFLFSVLVDEDVSIYEFKAVIVEGDFDLEVPTEELIGFFPGEVLVEVIACVGKYHYRPHEGHEDLVYHTIHAQGLLD